MKLSLIALASLVLTACSDPAGSSAPDAATAPAPVPADAHVTVDAGTPDVAPSPVCGIDNISCDCLPDGRLVPVSHDAVCDTFIADAVCEYLQAHKDILCPVPVDAGAE